MDNLTLQRRYSRRQVLKGLLATATTAVVANACGPAQQPAPTAAPTSAPAQQPTKPVAPTVPPTIAATPAAAQPISAIKRGGTLVQAINQTYPGMDPHTTTQPVLVGYEAMFNSLVRFQKVDPKTSEHKVVADLAESWEQPDDKTYVFHLRKGIKFHDGSDFNAQVAAWNVLRARDNPKSSRKTALAIVASVDAVDASTLRITTQTPNPAFLASLASVYAANVRMMSKVAFDKDGEDGAARQPVGTGPFRFKQWITDDRVIMERNPDYFETGADGKALPYLDGLISRFVPDPNVSLVDMRAGTLHAIDWLPLSAISTVKGDPNLGYLSITWDGQTYFHVGFNHEKPPFNDVRVRRAALCAIDREGMAKALGFGVGLPHYYGHFAPGCLGYDETVEKNAYDPAKVKQLLTDAGYPNGISIELKAIAREPENTIGEYAQQMWSAVGIKTKLVSLERTAWIEAMQAKNFEAGFWRGATFVVDTDLMKGTITSGAPGNWGQYVDTDIDKLMDQGGAIMDRQTRQGVYRQVLQLLQERGHSGSGVLIPVLTAYRKEMQDLALNFQVLDLRRTWLKS